MGSKSIRAINSASRCRRRSNSNRNFAAGKKIVGNCGSAGVEEKLEMLKNLLPSYTQNQQGGTVGVGELGGAIARGKVAVKADNDLLRRTADYIVLLRSQIYVLQKLIDFYSSQKMDDQNASADTT